MEAALYTLSGIGILLTLIIVHEGGHFVAAKSLGIWVESFSIGFGKPIVKWETGGTVYALKLLCVGGSVGFGDAQEAQVSGRADSLYKRPPIQKALVAVAGPFANIVLAYGTLLTMILFLGIPGVETKPGLLVEGVNAEGPAIIAGVRAQDLILAVGGERLASGSGAVAQMQARLVSQAVTSTPIEVRRGGQVIVLEVVPTTDGKLGVRLLENKERSWTQWEGIPELFEAANSQFMRVSGQVSGGLAKALLGQTDLSRVSGPVGIVAQTTQALERDASNGFLLGALLSMALALFNLMPIPPLDGGQIVWAACEMVTGKPIRQKAQEQITRIGVAGLLFLSLLVVMKDIAELVLAR